MKVTFDIPQDKFNVLEVTAKELGLDSTELIKLLLFDQISNDKEEFNRVADYVLQKNKELYNRLA